VSASTQSKVAQLVDDVDDEERVWTDASSEPEEETIKAQEKR